MPVLNPNTRGAGFDIQKWADFEGAPILQEVFKRDIVVSGHVVNLPALGSDVVDGSKKFGNIRRQF